jgi:hypothetical protein
LIVGVHDDFLLEKGVAQSESETVNLTINALHPVAQKRKARMIPVPEAEVSGTGFED